MTTRAKLLWARILAWAAYGVFAALLMWMTVDDAIHYDRSVFSNGNLVVRSIMLLLVLGLMLWAQRRFDRGIPGERPDQRAEREDLAASALLYGSLGAFVASLAVSGVNLFAATAQIWLLLLLIASTTSLVGAIRGWRRAKRISVPTVIAFLVGLAAPGMVVLFLFLFLALR